MLLYQQPYLRNAFCYYPSLLQVPCEHSSTLICQREALPCG